MSELHWTGVSTFALSVEATHHISNKLQPHHRCGSATRCGTTNQSIISYSALCLPTNDFVVIFSWWIFWAVTPWHLYKYIHNQNLAISWRRGLKFHPAWALTLSRNTALPVKSSPRSHQHRTFTNIYKVGVLKKLLYWAKIYDMVGGKIM